MVNLLRLRVFHFWVCDVLFLDAVFSGIVLRLGNRLSLLVLVFQVCDCLQIIVLALIIMALGVRLRLLLVLDLDVP